jgi:hypothetical protein
MNQRDVILDHADDEEIDMAGVKGQDQVKLPSLFPPGRKNHIALAPAFAQRQGHTRPCFRPR